MAIALALIAVLAATATAACTLFGEAIAVAFVGTSSQAAVTALALTMAVALPLGNIVMFSFLLIARGHERDTLLPFSIGGLLTIALAILAVALEGARVDLVAAALLTGQLVTMAGLGLRLHASAPDVAPAARRAIALAALVALLACASLLPGAAVPAGLALVAVAAAVGAGLRSLATSLLADLRRLRDRRGADRADF